MTRLHASSETSGVGFKKALSSNLLLLKCTWPSEPCPLRLQVPMSLHPSSLFLAPGYVLDCFAGVFFRWLIFSLVNKVFFEGWHQGAETSQWAERSRALALRISRGRPRSCFAGSPLANASVPSCVCDGSWAGWLLYTDNLLIHIHSSESFPYCKTHICCIPGHFHRAILLGPWI